MNPPETPPPPIPRGPEGAPAFDAPWQARAFALAVHLNATGALAWDRWTAVLTEELAARPGTATGRSAPCRGASAAARAAPGAPAAAPEPAAEALAAPAPGNATPAAAATARDYWLAWLAALDRVAAALPGRPG